MTFRSVMTGLNAGLLLCLALLYPALGLVAPLLMPGWSEPIRSPLLHGFLLMLSAVLCLPVLVGIGPLVAWRSKAGGLAEGARAGALAGLIAGAILFMGIVSPLNALYGYGQVIDFHLEPGVGLPEARLVAMAQALLISPTLLFALTAGAMMLIGATGSALYARQNRAGEARLQPTLQQIVSAGHHPQSWLAESEAPVKVGVLVGLILGFLLALDEFGRHYLWFAEQQPEVMEILSRNMSAALIATRSFSQYVNVLSPVTVLAYAGFGAVAVLLLKNPSGRFRTRLATVTLASFSITMTFMLVQSRGIYFNMGVFLFFVPVDSATWSGLRYAISPAVLDQLLPIVRTPAILTPLVFLGAWMMFTWTAVLFLTLGLVQGAVYSLVLPRFRPAPVDQAAAVCRRLRKNPTELLPVLQGLFSGCGNAYEVLPHVAARLHRDAPDAARLAAALHTLGTGSPAEQIEAARAAGTLLATHPDWRWAKEFCAVYHLLDRVLSARTLDQVMAIREPLEQQTASLPPFMAISVQFAGRVIRELEKVEKVQDLATKLIFLENSLAQTHAAERYLNEESSSHDRASTSPPPEQPALLTALDHWQGLIITAIRHLKGRAYVTCQLVNKNCCAISAQVPLIWEVANQGLNVAQQVHLRLLAGDDYQLTEVAERTIEILSPGDLKEISLPVVPANGVRRLRVAWQIVYDDAVDANRKLAFADVLAFVDSDKPFQRIFPIPYVTGTPLKADHVFVGREDVFAFIRENLLGAHQNNVIILHGQRRTGKTSVLYRLRQLLHDSHYGVLVDMQGKPARGEADFLYSLADDIVFALEEAGIAVDLPPRAAFEEAPEFFFRSRFLRSLYPCLNGKNLLFLFDEFEELQRRVEDGRLQPEIFQFLRNLMQHEQQLDFVFSGTHKLEDLGAEYWSVLFNIAAYKPITFLSPAEVRRLVVEPVAAYNVEYDPLAVERIINVAAGHPYFTQLILHEMIVYHNETERNYLTVVDVNEVLERIVKRGEAHFKYIWAESSQAEREALQGLAELLVGEEQVSGRALVAYLLEQGCRSDDQWERALFSLESRDIVTRRNGRNPLYRFKVDLIRLWIDRTRPSRL
jgi:hypothetical protein